jgi:hypothetical protein
LLRLTGWPKVERVLQLIDAVEALDIHPADVALDYWHHVHNRLSVNETPRPYTRGRHQAWLRRRINTVVVVEHDMSVAAASDWIIDVGPGAGNEGGTIVASGVPNEVAAVSRSRTARYLAECLGSVTHR